MFDSRHIGLYILKSFLFSFLKLITIIAFFHAKGIRLSDKHLVYSLASVFKMVFSPAFNVSIKVQSSLYLSSRCFPLYLFCSALLCTE